MPMLSRTQTEILRIVEHPIELDRIAVAISKRPQIDAGENTPSKESQRSTTNSLGPAEEAVPTGKTKLCTKCKTYKPVGRFPPHKDTKDGLAAHCKDCRAVLRKRRNDTNFEARLKHHFAARMAQQLQGMDELPPLVANMESYVGYKMKDLVVYLGADLFEREGITLADAFERGYHIDHIVALSTFPVKHVNDKAFKECWAMDNLRAISSEDNLKKGSKDVFGDDA